MKKLGLHIIASLVLFCGCSTLLADNDGSSNISGGETMDFDTQILLGSCYYRTTDAGEILTTINKINSVDRKNSFKDWCETWYHEWLSLAERIENNAKESEFNKHPISARNSYLRAAAYFATSAVFIDGTKDPSRGVSAWECHHNCWKKFYDLMEAEEVNITYGDTTIPGCLFRPKNGNAPFATIIFNNGSDGPTSAMWGCGVAGALERGYAALVFDGPGQNSMLWENHIPFRPDWENVITPVIDFLKTRNDVDPNKIVLSGISQGGYWVLRALAFLDDKHKIAAGILDPGVMDVSTAWFFPGFPDNDMLDDLKNNREEEFNMKMKEGLDTNAAFKQNMLWRMKPYCTDSFFQVYKKVQDYKVSIDDIKKITCPMFIADPEGEQFWPGQSQAVYDALTPQQKEKSKIIKFTKEEGSNWHCEPMARSLYDQRMFDWLATVVPSNLP